MLSIFSILKTNPTFFRLSDMTMSKTSTDCIKYFEIDIEAPKQSIYRRSHQFVVLNEEAYTILPKKKCTISFDVRVFTSKPTVSILSCEPYIHKQNIYHNISIIKNNHEPLHIDIFNNNDTTFTIHPFSFSVNCTIIVGSFDSLPQ